jgi:hypothetical protein
MSQQEERALQYHDGPVADRERRLLWAVLLDAVHCYRRNRPTARSVRVRRAWLRECRWFQSDDRSSPFCFVSICDALGLDASYVRRLLGSSEHRWRKRVQRRGQD